MIKGVGIDAISIDRIKRAIEKRGDFFLRRVFTKAELDDCSSSGNFYEKLAGRFAAKEAVFKAMGHVSRSRLNWKDVEIQGDDIRGIRVIMGSAICKLAKEKEIKEIIVSLSHDRTSDIAIAVALVF